MADNDEKPIPTISQKDLFPYGESDVEPTNGPADAWTRLSDIDELLRQQKPLPAELASWLGYAIAGCSNDPKVFLKLLGLTGKDLTHDKYAWLTWGRRIDELVNKGWAKDNALLEVQADYESRTGKNVSRSTLQVWVAKVKKAKASYNHGAWNYEEFWEINDYHNLKSDKP